MRVSLTRAQLELLNELLIGEEIRQTQDYEQFADKPNLRRIGVVKRCFEALNKTKKRRPRSNFDQRFLAALNSVG